MRQQLKQRVYYDNMLLFSLRHDSYLSAGIMISLAGY